MEPKKNIDKFQGYPHYPANEDIMRSRNNNGKFNIDAGPNPTPPYNDTTDERDGEVSIVQGTDADVTSEDLNILEMTAQNMDSADSRNLLSSSLDSTDSDGDPLNEDGAFLDTTGSDLDIPGGELDDADENIAEEDEENNFYSLGGDLHESQEENKGD